MPVVVAESDQDCAAFLEKRFPAAVNVGDWTQIDCVGDLPCVEPGLITAGLPCQPVSSAGSRGGDMDARWLFDDLAQLLFRSDERPLLLLENVPALLSRPFRRTFSRWCCTMTQMGYRITQTRVAAAEVGAPHRRQRWFALATHPDSVSAFKMLSAGSSTCISMSTSGYLLPTPTAADAVRGAESTGVRSAQRNLGNALLPTPLASDARGVPQSIRLPGVLLGGPPCDPSASIADQDGRIPRNGWQKYQTAVDAWSVLMGRYPPEQVQATNGERLLRLISPELTEWMMGFDPCWVTEIMDTRAALSAIGNSVCPQQGRLAVARLMQRSALPQLEQPKMFAHAAGEADRLLSAQ